MSRRLYREFYLLPRGEQRALILLSLLLILSLLFRITVQLLPDREPEGMEEFEQEASLLMAFFAQADSLQQLRSDSVSRSGATSSSGATPYTFTAKTGYSAQPIDINRADSAQLLPLPGIGPVYAGRIIKYRSLLGGFVSVEQLGEVYGISPETVDGVANRIFIDTRAVNMLDLNSATFKELLRHPYLEYEDVKALANYRDFKGSIQSIQELQENYILSDSLLNRVIPYLYLIKSEAVDLSK
jgi:DNA uptake protein ComE-like DNA-binding protein